MAASRIIIMVRDADDLDRILANSSADLQRTLHFAIEGEGYDSFDSFVRFNVALGGIFHRLGDVQEVVVQSYFDWSTQYAYDFMGAIALLPNLKSFSWLSPSTTTTSENNEIAIAHLTTLFTRCPGLESVSLDGLHFHSSAMIDQAQPDGTTAQESETLTHFCNILKRHSSLKLFQCVHCRFSEFRLAIFAPVSRASLNQLWVKKTLESLAYIDSLQCIDIRVAPLLQDQGRALLGLCIDGANADAAIERFKTMLQQEPPLPMAYPKLRLWIAERYKRKNGPQLFLDLCQILSGNTWLEDFRVRGVDTVAARFITSKVLASFKELLESGQNVTLTSCDLMTRQGGEVDLCCRLNGVGRGVLLRRLEAMSRQDWLESIVMRFSNDLDALYYWLRLQPVFVTSVLPIHGTLVHTT